METLVQQYQNDPSMGNAVSQEIEILLGHDAGLWTSWIGEFIYTKLYLLLTVVPVVNPRLDMAHYQSIINELFDADPLYLLYALRKWSKISPPLFDHDALINKLQRACGKSIQQLQKNEISRTFLYLESLSLVYLAHRQSEAALDCFFRIEELVSTYQGEISLGVIPLSIDLRERDCRRIFELIEQQRLYDVVANRILALVRVSRELTQEFLVRNVHIFPVRAVVTQLSAEKDLMISYLNALMDNIPDEYNSAEYASLHEEHIRALINNDTDCTQDILRLLEYSRNIDPTHALQLCAEHFPPLTKPSIHLLTKSGRFTEALSLLMEHGGSAVECIDFVERHGTALWDIVVERALQQPTFLSELLDKISEHTELASDLIEKLPVDSFNREVRQKTVDLLGQMNEKVIPYFLGIACLKSVAE